MKNSLFFSVLLLCSLLILPLCKVSGQGITGFLVPNHTPLAYNPAFVGALEKGRASFTGNIGSVSAVGGYLPKNFNLAWDQRLDRLKGGLGASLTVNHDVPIWGVKAEAMYSPKLKLSPRWSLAPGLGVSLGFFTVNRDAYKPSVPDNAIGEGDTLSIYPDLRFGFLLNSSGFYFGADLNHIFQPQVSVFPGLTYPGPLLRRLSLQTGFTLGLGKKSQFSLSNHAMLSIDNNLWVQDIVSLKYRELLTGIGLGHNDMINSIGDLSSNFVLFLLGVKGEKMKLTYTLSTNVGRDLGFDLTVNEVSLIWYLPGKT